MKSKFFSQHYVSIIIAITGLYIGIVFSNNNYKLTTKIILLEQKQKDLIEKNKILSKQRDSLNKEIVLTQMKIKEFELIETELNNKKIELEKKLKKNNKRYEKTYTHSDNYTSDSIRQYFSNF